MDLGRACVAQQLDQTAAGRAANDRVVDHDDALALDRGAQGVQLEAHRALALVLTRLNKGTGDITVFDEADAVRDARELGVADGCRDTGVRHADNDVRADRMLNGQILASLLTGKLDRRAVDDGVRTGEINILKYAGGGLALNVAVHRAQLAVFYDADLTRLHVADKLRAERVERAGLGGEYIAVAVQQTDAERTEAVGVARSDQLARRHDHE